MRIDIIGGGTVNYVRNHLAISAPAYGSTANYLWRLIVNNDGNAFSNVHEVGCHLTKMADQKSKIETNDDLKNFRDKLILDPKTKVVIFSAAVADFYGDVEDIPSGKYAQRLTSDKIYDIKLTPAEKIVSGFRGEPHNRKDIFLVSFKTTTGFTPEQQYTRALKSLKATHSNVVFANDTVTRLNMVVVPEEAAYHITQDRESALKGLLEMVCQRSSLTYTRSTVVPGEPVPWQSELIPDALRKVVDHCIARGAYKPVSGKTAGHFAVKLTDKTFLTSQRKTNFNDLDKLGLVRIETVGEDTVIAYGSKPSVGGQSQRIVFAKNPDADCIVHFHCEQKPDSKVPTVPQKPFECGSMDCGTNTAQGLQSFGEIRAVNLDNHGPNIVFNHSIDPQEVINFIEDNFDLTKKSGGFQLVEN